MNEWVMARKNGDGAVPPRMGTLYHLNDFRGVTAPYKLPTTFKFTGQRQEASLGLYYYGARWYDPALGRFAQADTIVPQPGNPMAWDRYAYTLNNPVRFIDPSGHMMAEADDGGGVTPEILIDWIEQVYEFDVIGEDWNTTQLFSVLEAAIEIRNYVADIRGEDTLEWMRTYLGGTKIDIWMFNSTSMGPDSNSVYLAHDFETKGWQGGVVGMIIHELGHVLDNRFGSNTPRGVIYPSSISGTSGNVGISMPAVISGGGPADALYTFLGGKLNFLRFNGGINLAENYKFPQSYSYGNVSSADYFAETFSTSIVDSTSVPIYANMWMHSFIGCMP